MSENIIQPLESVKYSFFGFEKFRQFIPLNKHTKQPVFKSQGFINKKSDKVDVIGIDKETGVYNPESWRTIHDIKQYNEQHKHIIPGFVFTDDLGLFFIDLDSCFMNSQLSDQASFIIHEMAASGCYVEMSLSGKGFHIIGKRPSGFPGYHDFKKFYKSKPQESRPNDTIEFYVAQHYVALTFQHASGNISNTGSSLLKIADAYCKRETSAENRHQTHLEDRPRNDWNGYKSDKKLIEKMLNFKTNDPGVVFGSKVSFRDLWELNVEKLSAAYPPQKENDPFNRSLADQALAGWLAFGTGCHRSRIKKLIEQSPLMRNKWEREDYKRDTVEKAISNCTRVYDKDFYKQNKTAFSPENIIQKTFSYDDVGIAERTVRKYGSVVKYTHQFGWMIYNSLKGIWESDQTFGITRIVNDTVTDILQDSATDITAKAYRQYRKNSNIQAVISQVKAQPYVAVADSAFDRNKYLLGTENGVIDLKTGDLHQHNAEYMITKQVPIKYQTRVGCPEWESFLNEIFSEDSEVISYIRRIVGYSLTGDISEQCFFFLYGTGANGKTVFLETIQGLLGDYSLQASFSDFLKSKYSNPGSPTPEIARLKGSRFVVAAEVGSGEQFDEAKIKDITGGGKITGRYLRKNPIEFTPECKIFLAANNRPVIKEKTHGIWRRLKVIPFEVTIPPEKQDKHLLEKLRREWPGILNWAVKGCIEWQQQGLKEPGVVSKETSDYRDETDFFKDFFNNVIDSSNPLAFESSDDIYTAFHNWLERPENEATCNFILRSTGSISKTKLGKILKDRGFNQSRSGKTRQRVWLGISLKK